MTTLPRLREALSLVKEATGPGDELDAALMPLLHDVERRGDKWFMDDIHVREEHYSGSLDAVVSLIREMPEWLWKVEKDSELKGGAPFYEAQMWSPDGPSGLCGVIIDTEGHRYKAPALALLAALLKAKIADMEREEEAA